MRRAALAAYPPVPKTRVDEPPVAPTTRCEAVRATQEEILRRMQTILANMLKHEGYREAVALLQEVIDEQGQVRSATLELLRRQLETILNLEEPAEASPTDVPKP